MSDIFGETGMQNTINNVAEPDAAPKAILPGQEGLPEISSIEECVKNEEQYKVQLDQIATQMSTLRVQKTKLEEAMDQNNQKLTQAMDKLGTSKMTIDGHKLNVRSYKAKVEVVDKDQVPAMYTKQHVTTTIDKTKIYEDLTKNPNAVINGVKLVPVRKTNIK